MGGVPVKHHSKGKVGRRRSHHALKPVKVHPCKACKGPKLPHRECMQCGSLGRRSEKAPVTAAQPDKADTGKQEETSG